MENKKSLFCEFEIGYGKTSLCFVLAVLYAVAKKTVFIINSSKNLSFRDYKKASAM